MSDDKKKNPDEKAFSMADLQTAITATAKSIAEEMAPVLMAASASAANRNAPISGRARNFGPTCEVCKQLVTACGGVPKIEGEATKAKQEAAYSKNHVKMAVFPSRYPEFAEWFRGRGLNGVWYLSNNANHQIWVPRAAAGDFAHCIQVFEDNERETRMGRVKNHNSGSVNSPNKVSDSAGEAGWR